MNTWVRRLEKFVTPAYKNLSVQIQSSSPHEIETVLDAIAKDADWKNKTIKDKKGYRDISYHCYSWYIFLQIIEVVFIPENDAIRLDIQSRYWYTKNKLAILFERGFITYYDIFLLNRTNIQYISTALHTHFKDRAIGSASTPTSSRNTFAAERRSPRQRRSRHAAAAGRRKTGASINTPADHRHSKTRDFSPGTSRENSSGVDS